MKDFLGNEIKIGDIIIYVTSKSGTLQKGAVLGFKNEVSKYNGSIIQKVHVLGHGNLIAGYTFPDRIFVLCTK